ncbi:MAG: hypothetical protein IKX26_09105 [Bacteroidales bacterium]|nr:hypothetical protein [Bacteroidales bacterium]
MFISAYGCKSEAQRQEESLNLDSLKTLTVMGSPDFAKVVDSLSKAYNTEDKHLIDSARAAVKDFDKMIEADSLSKDALMWALYKKDLLFYIPEMNFNKILGYQMKFRELYLKYMSENDINKEILKDNEDAFLYFTAKPVNADSVYNANLSYENLIFNMFKANVYLGNLDVALGYNEQMTYLITQRYGKHSFKYAKCLADGMKLLVMKGCDALAFERLREAENILNALVKEAAGNPDADIPADTLSARLSEIRQWYNDNAKK